MKGKCILNLVVALSFLSSVYSQPTINIEKAEKKKIFAKVFASYGFLTKGSFQIAESSSTRTDGSNKSETFQTQKNGLGGGLRVGAGIGLISGRYINIGLDGEYLMGNSLTSTTSIIRYERRDVPNESGPPSNQPDTTVSNGTYKLTHRIVSIIPHVTFKAITTEYYHIYTRVGVIVGIPLEIKATENIYSLHKTDLPAPAVTPDNFNYYTEISSGSTYEYKTTFGLGYQAALGIQFDISKNHNLGCYIEIISNSMILQPSEYNQTDHTTTTRNKNFNQPNDIIDYDYRRSILQFKKTGSSTIVTTGTGNRTITKLQTAQISMAVNSLNFCVGFAYRF